MGNYYGSSMIGLDVKPRKKCRPRRNHYNRSYRWLLPVIVAIITLGLIVIAGAR